MPGSHQSSLLNLTEWVSQSVTDKHSKWSDSGPIKKITTEMIHPNVSDLPGLLLLVVLAVHSAVDHQTTWSKVRQVGYPWKGLSKNILVLQSSCLWVRWGGKEPNLQNLPLAAFYHFGASWKAVIARSLTFEQRQIEGWSWWQNWPISCAFQLCCWVGDLKTNSLGSRPASMKM